MSLNPIDETLDELDREQGRAPAKVNPYDETLDLEERRRKQRMQIAAGAAEQQQPDRAAEIKRLSQRTSLPASFIERNYDQIRKRATQVDTPYTEMIRETPALASFLEDPLNAAIARDDVPNLGMLDRSLRVGRNLIGAAGAGVAQFSAGMWGFLRQQSEAALANPNLGGSPILANLLGRPAVADFAEGAARVASHLADRMRGRQEGAGFVESSIYSGVESIGMMAPTAVMAILSGGETAMLAAMGATTSGLSYDEARNQGVDPGKANLYAALDGAVEVATELIPVKWLIKDIKGSASFAKLLAHQITSEVPGEQIATVLQDLDAWAFLPANKDRTFADYLAERPSAAAATLISTVTMVALTAGAGHGTRRMIEKLGGIAEKSETFKRSPEAVAEFVEKAAEGGVTTLYQDPTEWAAYWQEQGIDPRQKAAEVTGDPNAYDNAIRLGHELAIPMARYAVTLAGTEHNAHFAETLRIEPGETTGQQADEKLAAALADEVGKTGIPGESAGIQNPVPEGLEALRTDLVAQLRKAGYDPTAAATNVDVVLKAANLALRAGLDPVETLARYGLKVQREDLEVAKPPQARPAGPAGTAPAAPGDATAAVQGEGAAAEGILPLDAAESPEAVAGDVAGSPSPADVLTDTLRTPAEGDTLAGDGQAPQDGGNGGTGSAPGDTRTGDHVSDSAPQPVEARESGAPVATGRPAGSEARGIEQVPASWRPYFTLLASDARERGFDGDDNSLADLFLQAVADSERAAEDLNRIESDVPTHRDLLEKIVKLGGFNIAEEGGADGKAGMVGELEHFLDSLTRQGKGINPRTFRPAPKQFTHVGKIPGGKPHEYIVRRKGAKGYSVDRMRELIQEDPRWENKYDNISDFLQDVADAIAIETGVMKAPGQEGGYSVEGILQGVYDVRPGSDWWRSLTPAGELTIDETGSTNNASGESAASLEAISRQRNMQARGESFVVYDRTGARRLLIGVDAVDYVAQAGETYGIEGPDGFRVLDDRGGAHPAPATVNLLAESAFEDEVREAGEVYDISDTSFDFTELEQIDPDIPVDLFAGRPSNLPEGQGPHVSGLPIGTEFDRVWKKTRVRVRLQSVIPGGEVWAVEEIAKHTGKIKGLLFHEGWRFVREDTTAIPGAQADLLSTGEVQPRLPGDVGAVRDQEVKDRDVADLPFSLTAPTAKAEKPKKVETRASVEFMQARQDFKDASDALDVVTKQYRAREVDDATFLAARAAFDRAMAAYDAAEAKEVAQRGIRGEMTLFQEDRLTRQDVDAFAEDLKAKTGPDLVELTLDLMPAGNLQFTTMAIRRGATRAGLGTAIVQAVTKFADQHGVRIVLFPAGRGYSEKGSAVTTSQSRLIKFYKRFGFVVNEGANLDPSMPGFEGLMYRDPTVRATELFQGDRLNLSELGDFKTGQPVTFEYMRRTARAPRPGPDDQFLQKVEPAGRYMLVREGSPGDGIETGKVTFSSPLVIETPVDYSEPDNWKRAVSAAYGGKTGLRLSRAILADGFDAVVTIARSNVQPNYVSEIVDLTVIGTPAKRRTKLIAQHNITAAKLRNAIKMGGLAVPSLAITSADDPMVNFGDITLIGSRDLVDPQRSAQTKVFGADVYSPRYPTVHYKLTADAEKTVGKLYRKHAAATGLMYFDLDSVQTDGPRFFERESTPLMAEFLIQHDVTLPAPTPDRGKYARPGQIDDFQTRHSFQEAIRERGLEREYATFAAEFFESLGASERIFKGYTDAGNRRYKEHTLANVVAELSRNLRGGETSGNLYGTGQLRAKFTPQFRSIKAIQGASKLLVDDATFDRIKEEMNTELFEIGNALQPYYEHGADSFRYIDTVLAVMEDSPRLGIPRALREYGFADVPVETQRTIAEFLEKLRTLPTEYFEVLLTRAVDLSEFAGAVVPADTPLDLVQALEAKGLTVAQYDKADDKGEGRKRAIREAAESLGTGVLFQKKRGAIRFGADRQMTIALFERANLSTFIHEAGHFYLEVFGDVVDALRAMDPAQLNPSQQKLLADYSLILQHIGAESREQIDVEHHEKFARSFEAYLMEGNAPSEDLRTAFARVRAWMLDIYQSLKALRVSLSPEVRRVFDRMLATDAEIFQVENAERVTGMFLTAEQAGKTEAEFRLYTEEVEAASRVARENLEAKVVGELRREQRREWKARRQAVEAEVRAEVEGLPVYKAIIAMQRGTTPQGDPLLEGFEIEPLKLNREALVEAFGKDRLKRLPKPYIYETGGKYDPEVVADMFDFSSADEMLTAVENAAPMEAKIQHETDQRMIAEHGSVLLDGRLHERARAAVANDRRDAVIRSEMLALRKLEAKARPILQAGEDALAAERKERAYERRWFEAETKLAVALAKAAKQEVVDELRAEVRRLKAHVRRGRATLREGIPSDATVREAARRVIAGQKIRNIKPGPYWFASRKAAQLAIEAAAGGNYNTAIRQKGVELLNLALYRMAVDARDEVEARVLKVKELVKGPARARLGLAGGGILDQVDGILDRFSFATVSQKALDRRASLAKWIAEQEGEGHPINLPDEILEEQRRQPYQELTFEQFLGVTDGLAQLVHLARLKNRLLKAQAERELSDVAQEIADSIAGNAKRHTPTPIETRLPQDAPAKMFAGFNAWQRKLASLAREMDGGKDGGAMWEHFIRPINEAVDAETIEKEKAALAFIDAISGFTAADMISMNRRVKVDEIGDSMTRAAMIMVALNWGNEGNRQRLLSGYGWTEAQGQAILDRLTAADWKFVKASWAQVSAYKPQIIAKQTRVYGVAPEMVEATPFMTKFGEMPGGYFPIKYDTESDPKAFAKAVEDVAKQMMAGAVTNASTRRGYTQARAKKVTGRRVQVDFSVIWSHVAEVVHDLTHHEMLIDVNRLLRHPLVSRAIREHYGMPVYREMQAAIMDIAAGDIPVQHHGERALEWFRQGTSIARMGWNLSTAILQPLGASVGFTRRVGPYWMAKGLTRFLGDAARMENTVAWIHSVDPMMRLRHKTQNREISEVRNRIQPRGSWALAALGEKVAGRAGARVGYELASKYAVVEDTYFRLISAMQSVADTWIWLGEYAKASADPANAGDEQRIIALAGQAVIDTQGSGHIKDLAHSMRGTPTLKIFTQFMGYFSVVYNQGAEAVGTTKLKSPAEVGRLAVDLLMLYTVPMLLEQMIRSAIKGPDDKDEDGVLLWFAKNQASYMLNTVVGLRELASVPFGFDYKGAAGAGVFAEAASLGKQVAQWETDEAFLVALNNTAGIVFHYPATQVERMVRSFIALEDAGTSEALAALAGRKPAKD